MTLGTPIAMMVRNQEKRTTDLPCDLYLSGLGSRVSGVRVDKDAAKRSFEFPTKP